MKTTAIIATLAAALAIATPASAQIRLGTSGSMLLTGGIDYSHQSSDTTVGGVTADGPSTDTISLGPQFGYFLTDGFMLGVDLDWIRVSASPADSDDSIAASTFTVALQPAYYYALRPTRSLNLYARAKIGYASNSTSATVSGTSTDTGKSGWLAGGGAGVAFAFGDYWGAVIHLGVDFRHLSLSNDEGAEVKETFNTISVGTDIGVYF
ncbi:MAG: hypothetical protein ACI9WU_000432 [Myxococcota bacterium]|jgi:hypothetical protein